MSDQEGREGGAWRAHLPNALTSVRVVMACVLFVLLSLWGYMDSPARGGRTDWVLVGAAALFGLAAATDALDGFLARRWRVVSVFGRIMDPFADKILVIGTFAFMASPSFTAVSGDELRQVSGVSAWMVAVILGRELLVTSIRGAMEGAGVSFSASWSGKWKMILQSVIAPLVMVIIATGGAEDRGGEASWGMTAIKVGVWACVVVTAWSGLPYVVRGVSAARELGARPRATGPGASSEGAR